MRIGKNEFRILRWLRQYDSLPYKTLFEKFFYKKEDDPSHTKRDYNNTERVLFSQAIKLLLKKKLIQQYHYISMETRTPLKIEFLKRNSLLYGTAPYTTNLYSTEIIAEHQPNLKIYNSIRFSITSQGRTELQRRMPAFTTDLRKRMWWDRKKERFRRKKLNFDQVGIYFRCQICGDIMVSSKLRRISLSSQVEKELQQKGYVRGNVEKGACRALNLITEIRAMEKSFGISHSICKKCENDGFGFLVGVDDAVEGQKIREYADVINLKQNNGKFEYLG